MKELNFKLLVFHGLNGLVEKIVSHSGNNYYFMLFQKSPQPSKRKK
jgi:hypothetical protein